MNVCAVCGHVIDGRFLFEEAQFERRNNGTLKKKQSVFFCSEHHQKYKAEQNTFLQPIRINGWVYLPLKNYTVYRCK